jgi:hypothetical protein
MDQSTDTPLPITPPSLFDGRDEMNFAEISPTLLTDRAPDGQTSFRRELRLFDQRRKNWFTGVQLVEGSQEHGLPTAGDNLVHLALIQLSKLKNNFSRPDLEFTRAELLGLLGWSDQGRNYQRIEKALLRLKHVTYEYRNAWWDHRQKAWTTRAFSIIDNVDINDGRRGKGQEELFQCRIKWNEVIFESFQAGYLRSIDFEQCRKFHHPISLQMYRFLGKREHLGQDVILPLEEFAFGHIGLTGNYADKAQIVRKLRPGLEELEAIGFLVPMQASDRFFKRDREWHIRLIFSGAKTQAARLAPVLATSTVQDALATALVERGVTLKTAKDLVRDHPPALLERQLDAFDWLKEQKDTRIARNPAGYLVASIRDGYATPNGFVAKTEREAQRRQDQAEQDRVKAIQAQEKAILDRCRAYWETLTPAALKALDDEAMASASSDLRHRHERAQMGVIDVSRLVAIELEIRKAYTLALLESTGRTAA